MVPVNPSPPNQPNIFWAPCAKKGSEGYAVEELVAELGAAFLCADLELALEPREDHASYIATWLKVLATDNRAVFTAATHAQRAAEFINHKATASGRASHHDLRGMK
jgi:antirestriction protein ArdC